MLHSTAILALAVSRDSELLASGSADGAVKVWRILTGACVRRYDAAHSGAVTSLSFSRDSAHVLSSSLDGTARIHGLKSGRMLRELRGHDGFVHCAAYSSDCEHVATGSADGTMRVWAARTGETLVVVRVPSGGGGPTPAVLGVSFLPQTTGSPQLLLLCLGSDRLQLATLGGTLGLTLHANTPVSAHFVAATASPRGGWIYGLTQAGVVCCFRAATGQLERRLEAHEGVAAIGLCHHPHANRLATFARDHLLKLWSA
jgi:WD40 repeat-containing protein SMU1